VAKKKFLKKGRFITFEGPEGSGKSTHARLLYAHLKKSGYDCIFTREPGGTPAGEKIRKILLREKNINVNKACELFLFEASRAQIVKDVILPALRSGKVVICDRFTDATIAYQGFGEGLDIAFVERLNNLATDGLVPALTVLLDIDSVEGLKRRLKVRKADRIESKSKKFHKKVRKGYLYLAKKYPKRIKLISTDGSINRVQENVREVIIKCLSRT